MNQPNDLAARLDLAHRYLDVGMIEESLSQYAVALDLDPDDAELVVAGSVIVQPPPLPLKVAL